MVVPVVVAALLFWVCVFLIYFASIGTTPLQFFLGRYETPPVDLGQWKAVGVEPCSELLREERCLLPYGPNSRELLFQVRYRDAITRIIVRVDPERRVPRRRVSAR